MTQDYTDGALGGKSRTRRARCEVEGNNNIRNMNDLSPIQTPETCKNLLHFDPTRRFRQSRQIVDPLRINAQHQHPSWLSGASK